MLFIYFYCHIDKNKQICYYINQFKGGDNMENKKNSLVPLKFIRIAKDITAKEMS